MAQAEVVAILAAGQGTRMRSDRPKVLAEACGRPLLDWVLDQALVLEPERVLVVVGHGADQVREHVAGRDLGERVLCVTQEPQLGTGHALQCCTAEIEGRSGRLVVLYGDMPCLRPETLAGLCDAQRGRGLALLTARPARKRGFGRILRDVSGERVERIVEERDATPDEASIDEVNVGVYAFGIPELTTYLPRLNRDNAQEEYYLTDLVAAYVSDGLEAVPVALEDEREAVGVNTVEHLAEAVQALRARILEEHLAAGVSIEDPATTYIDHGVEIGAGTRVLPCTVIRSGVTVGAGCEVGPFTHLRAGTRLADGAEVGNFTEVKNSFIGGRTKAKHLSYLGDAHVGPGANIGAGTIFANYDGRTKHRCDVGEGAFIGSGTILVAPARVGDGAVTGAGAVLTRGTEVPAGETWVGVPARPLRKRSDPSSSSTGEAAPGRS